MRLLDALADLLLGASCPGCDIPGWGWCRTCCVALEQSPRLATRDLGFPVVAANDYRPLLARAIPRYKDDGALHLEPLLVRRLSAAVEALMPPPDAVLVPVPSRPSTVRARGFDHGRRLAVGAARTSGLRAVASLRRDGRSRDQLGLSAKERAVNLAGAMKSGAVPSPVVIVDDIVTTGASLGAAAKALRRGGAEIVGAAVIADADREITK